MLELSFNTECNRRLFGLSGDVSVEAELLAPVAKRGQTREKAMESELIPVSTLLKRFLEFAPSLVPSFEQIQHELRDGQAIWTIEDMRGRPSESFSNKQVQDRLKPGEEELFFTNGVIFDTPATLDEYEKVSTEELPSTAFSYRVSTRFDRFDGSRHIVHQFVPSGTSPVTSLMPPLSVSAICQCIPLRLDYIRVGIEFFKGRFFGAMLGSAPVIFNRFYLEISPERIQLKSKSELERGNDKLSPKSREVLSAFDKALTETGLYAGFLSSLEKQL